MKEQKPVSLFVGNDSESDKAIKAVERTGINLRIFNNSRGHFDFDPPLLISAWGVFEGLNSIVWFAKMASEQEINNVEATAECD